MSRLAEDMARLRREIDSNRDVRLVQLNTRAGGVASLIGEYAAKRAHEGRSDDTERKRFVSENAQHTLNKLNSLGKERVAAANNARYYRKNFIAGLQKDTSDLLIGFGAEHARESSRNARERNAFVASVTDDIASRLHNFKLDRNRNSARSSAERRQFVKGLETQVSGYLAGFRKDLETFSNTARQERAAFIGQLASDVSTQLGSLRKTRVEETETQGIRRKLSVSSLQKKIQGYLSECAEDRRSAHEVFFGGAASVSETAPKRAVISSSIAVNIKEKKPEEAKPEEPTLVKTALTEQFEPAVASSDAELKGEEIALDAENLKKGWDFHPISPDHKKEHDQKKSKGK